MCHLSLLPLLSTICDECSVHIYVNCPNNLFHHHTPKRKENIGMKGDEHNCISFLIIIIFITISNVQCSEAATKLTKTTIDVHSSPLAEVVKEVATSDGGHVVP